MITLITGQGQHANTIIQQLINRERDFQYFQYWPECRLKVFQNGRLLKEKRFQWYDVLRKIVWGVASKLKISRGNKRHIDLLFVVYDFLISFYLKDTELLIAWSQVSLLTMKKARSNGMKIQLEYPMIHVDSWMNIMKKEYDKYNVPVNNTSNLFSDFMIRRMKKEIALADEINMLSVFARDTFIANSVQKSKLKIREIDFPTTIFKSEKKSNSKFTVLFVGRVDLLKGVQYLLKAYNNIRTQNTELLLVGEISEEIKPLLRKYADSTITMMGAVTKDKLPSIYQMADVFVLPSIQESYGMVLLESIQYNLPIIASKSTGAPDIKERHSHLPIEIYDPYDIDKLTRILHKMILNHKSAHIDVSNGIASIPFNKQE